MATITVLTVDDEEHILELLKYNLEKNEFRVLQASNGEEALKILKEESVDVVVLDLMLPTIDGIEVLRRIRSDEKSRKMPVIMLTARSEEIDTVVGLEMGADDYIGKPFSSRELLARIKAVLRRTDTIKDSENNSKDKNIIKIDDIEINRLSREISIDNKKIELPLKEFELLWLLANNQGRVFERDYLLEKIWGYEYCGETRTIDVHIRNIRKKIEEDDKNPKYVKTIRGVGYKFK